MVFGGRGGCGYGCHQVVVGGFNARGCPRWVAQSIYLYSDVERDDDDDGRR